MRRPMRFIGHQAIGVRGIEEGAKTCAKDVRKGAHVNKTKFIWSVVRYLSKDSRWWRST